MTQSGEGQRLFVHRCAVCGCEWRTPFPPKKGIRVHCTTCHARLQAGEAAADIRKEARLKGVRDARQEYVGKKQVLYDSVCISCLQPCRVPFPPEEDRVVLCRACYAKRQEHH